MADFMTAYIKPGPPDQDCKVYTLDGKLKRIIESPKPAPEQGQIDCLGRPIASETRQKAIKQARAARKNKVVKYDWPEIIPKVIAKLEAGERQWKPMAEEFGIEYRVFTSQMKKGTHAAPVREWLREHGIDQKDHRKTLKAVRAHKEGS